MIRQPGDLKGLFAPVKQTEWKPPAGFDPRMRRREIQQVAALPREKLTPKKPGRPKFREPSQGGIIPKFFSFFK